jgi:DnaK suppressor protein
MKKKPSKAKKSLKVKKMGKTDIKYYKELLLNKKREVLEELNKNIDDGKKIEFNEVKDAVDLASDTYDTEFLHNLSDAEKKTIEDIDNALDKIEKGSYGYCDICKKSINKTRLRALPFTKNCIECQTRKEK